MTGYLLLDAQQIGCYPYGFAHLTSEAGFQCDVGIAGDRDNRRIAQQCLRIYPRTRVHLMTWYILSGYNKTPEWSGLGGAFWKNGDIATIRARRRCPNIKRLTF